LRFTGSFARTPWIAAAVAAIVVCTV